MKIFKGPEFYGGLLVSSVLMGTIGVWNWGTAICAIVGIIGVIENLKK